MTEETKQLILLSVDEDWESSDILSTELAFLDPSKVQAVFVSHFPEKQVMMREAAAKNRLIMYTIKASKNHGKISSRFANFRAFGWKNPDRILLFTKGVTPSPALASLAEMAECRGCTVEFVTDS